MPKFIVIENTPGYLPDDTDPGVYDTFQEALEAAKTLEAELIDMGYTQEGSTIQEANYYQSYWTTEEKMHDLGRVIEIMEAEE